MITIIGLVLKIALVSFGHYIMLIGLALLANSYFIGFDGILRDQGYQEFMKNRLTRKRPLYISIPSYAMALLLIGTLFKIMTWPMAPTLLLVGLIMMAVGFYFVFAKAKEDVQWKRQASIRMIIMSGLGLVFYLMPQFFWFDIFYREHPGYIEATKELYSDPENEAYQIRVEEERNKMKNGI